MKTSFKQGFDEADENKWTWKQTITQIPSLWNTCNTNNHLIKLLHNERHNTHDSFDNTKNPFRKKIKSPNIKNDTLFLYKFVHISVDQLLQLIINQMQVFRIIYIQESQTCNFLKLLSVFCGLFIFLFAKNEPGREDHSCVQIELAIVPGGWKCYAHNYAILSKTVGRQLMRGLSLSLFYA